MGRTSEVARELTTLLDQTQPRLQGIDEAGSLADRGPGSWSRRQVLGHLVDSALNNLQRFVRAQQGPLDFPPYAQEHWVAAGGYQDRSWADLVELWAGLNRQLAHVVDRLPDPALSTPCRIGETEPVTLEFLVRDYLGHLRHHLAQILDPEGSKGQRW